MSGHAFHFGLDAMPPAFTVSPMVGLSAGTLPDIGVPVVAYALRTEPDRWQPRTRSIGCRLVRVLNAGWPSELFPSSAVSPVSSLFSLRHSLRCIPRALRLFDVLLRLRRPAGLGFQTRIFRATTARLRSMKNKIFLRSLPESTSRHLGAGTYASLRAVCPEGDPGKYKQEK